MSRQPFNPALVKGPPPLAADSLLTVSQLTALVKQALSLRLPPTIHVVGQISNFKRQGSGHLYWTLKDNACELACVMWRSEAERLKFKPADGLEVIATGGVDVFERTGRYQLYVRRLEPRGVGALELAFRQLREKLHQEGLFDPARKKPLPRYPRRIVVVTSATGAAVRDILTALCRRFPCALVYLYPVRVQGEGAAAEIAEAIRLANLHAAGLGGIDVMIVGRGGGSLEDLWAFNEEIVARAIFASTIPVISGVGHEVDVTIADLVADVRAATPTAAAELAVPVLADLLDFITARAAVLNRCIRYRSDLARKTVEAVTQRTWLRDPLELLRRRGQRVDELAERVRRRLVEQVAGRLRVLIRAEALIQRIHPRGVLARVSDAALRRADRLRWALFKRLTASRQGLQDASLRLASRTPVASIAARAAAAASFEARGLSALQHRWSFARQRVDALAAMLEATSHRATLVRGFSITRRKKDRSILTDVASLTRGDRLLTETASGEVESSVVDKRQLELFD